MKHRRVGLGRAILVVGFFLILWMIGLALGEPGRVKEQAKSICLECIGIG